MEEKIGLGGGCHWCTEAVFQALRGISGVAQGFIRSDPPNDNWSEAIEVSFDPTVISLETLIDIHLRTHASTSAHKLRGKYRSAVYTFDEAQADKAEGALRGLQTEFEDPLQTRILCHIGFKASNARFQNYYATDPDRPFCQTYIDPKLRLLRERYAESFLVHSDAG
jgi:peptide-methionine (S)-S-oxide reductase